MTEIEVTLPVDNAALSGTLSVPHGPPAPGVLLIGGTFSDLRDGDPDPRHRPDIPPHGMYRVLADGLREAGYAVLRFDRRGCGRSSGSPPDRATEIGDALAAWRWLDGRADVAGAQAAVGESAGAYVLCRMMAAGARPSAVVLQGALFRSIAGLIAFNADRARAYLERGDAEREWMWAHARREYESAVLGDATVAALAAGQASVRVDDARGTFERRLDDLAYDIDHPPAEQFRHVTVPALVLHGADDLNVPVEDAWSTVGALWSAGNRDVELTIVAGADHSLQRTPSDADERQRERMSFDSFRRPFHERYPGVITEFLRRQLSPPSS